MSVINDFSPPHPDFSGEQLEACCQSGDAMPLMFQCYKHVGLVTIKMVNDNYKMGATTITLCHN